MMARSAWNAFLAAFALSSATAFAPSNFRNVNIQQLNAVAVGSEMNTGMRSPNMSGGKNDKPDNERNGAMMDMTGIALSVR